MDDYLVIKGVILFFIAFSFGFLTTIAVLNNKSEVECVKEMDKININ